MGGDVAAHSYKHVGYVAASDAGEMTVMAGINGVVEYFYFPITGVGFDFEPGAGALGGAVKEEGVDVIWCNGWGARCQLWLGGSSIIVRGWWTRGCCRIGRVP